MILNFKNKLSKSKIIVLLATILAGISILWLSKDYLFNIPIKDYSPQKDREFILDLFKKNWYWLVSEYSLDFSPEYMLDNKASDKEPIHKGNLTIKMAYENNKPVGFIAYYMKELYVGFVLFIAVDETSRGKGFARSLLDYAINDLKNKGASIIRLITRTSNLRGQKLYTGMGFKQVWTDGQFVKFEKNLE